MSVNVITQFTAKPGRGKDLIALVSRLLPEHVVRIRYYNEVLARDAPIVEEIPKVSTSDAPGG